MQLLIPKITSFHFPPTNTNKLHNWLNPFLKDHQTTLGCNHKSMSQFVYFVSKDYSRFAKKNFFIEKNFLIIIFTYYIFLNVSHFFVNHFWINMIFYNVRICTRFFCFILKNHHNFKSCQNMLIILRFIFLYHKLQFCFKHHLHCITFTCHIRLMNIK
jgi:hypothetical protein